MSHRQFFTHAVCKARETFVAMNYRYRPGPPLRGGIVIWLARALRALGARQHVIGLGAAVLRHWCVVGWLISDLSYWNIAKKDDANRSRATAFQCAHICYAFGKCIFSYPNVWQDIFRVPLTELRSVISQICTNRIVCSSVKPSQLDLDTASIKV